MLRHADGGEDLVMSVDYFDSGHDFESLERLAATIGELPS
jgi:hypothetical protein